MQLGAHSTMRLKEISHSDTCALEIILEYIKQPCYRVTLYKFSYD